MTRNSNYTQTYDVTELSDNGVCLLEEPSSFTYYGDDSIIDRAIAHRKAGGKFYSAEELLGSMRAVINETRRNAYRV